MTDSPNLTDLCVQLNETEKPRDLFFVGTKQTKTIEKEKRRIALPSKYTEVIKTINEQHKEEPKSIAVVYSPSLVSVFPLHYYDLFFKATLTPERLLEVVLQETQERLFATEYKKVDGQNRVILPKRFCENRTEGTIYGQGLCVNII